MFLGLDPEVHIECGPRIGRDSESGGAQRGRGSETGADLGWGRVRKEDEIHRMVVAQGELQREEELKEGDGGLKRRCSQRGEGLRSGSERERASQREKGVSESGKRI